MAKWENISKVNKISEDEHLLSVKYINNGEEIITSLSSGIVRIYKNKSMTTAHSLYHQSYVNTVHGRKPSITIPATSCLILPNTPEPLCLVCYTDGHLNLFNVGKEKILETVSEARQIFNVVHHPSEPQFVSLGEDGIIFLYDCETMKCVMKYRPSFTNRLDGHTSRVFAASFHPRNHNEFISGGWDNTVMFWDMRTPHAVKFISGPHIGGEGLDINWNGKEILTAAYQIQHQMQIWDYSTGKLRTTLNVDSIKSQLFCGKWLPGNHIVVGGTEPGILRVANVTSPTALAHFKAESGGVYSLDFKLLNDIASSSRISMQSKEQIKDFGSLVRIVFINRNIIFEADCKLEQ